MNPHDQLPGGEQRTMSRRSMLSLSGGLLATVGLGATGCGGAPATGGGMEPRTQAPMSPVSGASGTISILDDNTNMLFMDSVIAQFEADTGITVEYEQANFNDLHDRLTILFGAHDASYDVVMTWAAWTAEFGQAGWLQPLTKSVAPPDILPAALEAVTYDGNLYGLPKFASAQTMFWNKDLFGKAGLEPDQGPEDWDDFVAAAKELTGGEQYGYAADMGNTDGAYQNFLRVLLLNGGTMYDADNVAVFNSDAGVEALQRLVDLLHVDKVMNPYSMQITNSSDLSTLFADGRTGIVFNWPFQYALAVDSLGRSGIGNAIIPGMSADSASIDGSEGFAINNFSENKQAALTWLRYVTRPEVQTPMAQDEGWFPVTKTLLRDPDIVRSLPVAATYIDQAQYPIKRFGAPWYSEVTLALSTNISKAMLQDMSPEEALDDAAARADEIIDQYR